MLKVTLKEGESLAIGGNITVELKQIATSRRATILIDAPREIPVKRQKAQEQPRGAYAVPAADGAVRQMSGPAADGIDRQMPRPTADGTSRQMPRSAAAGAAVCQLAGSGAAR